MKLSKRQRNKIEKAKWRFQIYSAKGSREIEVTHGENAKGVQIHQMVLERMKCNSLEYMLDKLRREYDGEEAFVVWISPTQGSIYVI